MNPREEWHMDTRRLGRRVLVFDQLESTNSHAASLASDPANDGIVILADAQSAGRGQHGRSWQCPAGQGVLLSVLLSPPPALRRPVVLAAWVAVAVCETILKSTGLQAKIKWPNDVLIQGRKVSGILIEQRAVSSGQSTVGSRQSADRLLLPTAHCPLSTACGVGLNVNQSFESLAAAGLPEAGSLAMFARRSLVVRDVAGILIAQLDEEYDRLCQGDFATLEARWKWRIGLLGRQIVVECHDGMHRGRLCAMAFTGLDLELPGGGRVQLSPERVSHLNSEDAQ